MTTSCCFGRTSRPARSSRDLESPTGVGGIRVENIVDLSDGAYLSGFHPDSAIAEAPANGLTMRGKHHDTCLFNEASNAMLGLGNETGVACHDPLIHQQDFRGAAGRHCEGETGQHAG